MKRYKSKIRLEIKNADLGGEELSENKQVLGDTIERFEESKHRTKAVTQKSLYQKRKKESSRNEKNPMERYGETKKM